MLNTRDQLLCAAVDKYRDLMVEMEKTLWGCPEIGFQEWKTTRILREAYEKLGYTVFAPEDIPGFYVDIDTGRPGPKIMFCGELDALNIPEHPDNVDGIVHACGHHSQCCGVLGLAAALTEPGVLDGLCGSIRLMAIPAEEGDGSGFRQGLIRKGILHFESGKREFMYRGYMDGVDIGCMLHTCRSDYEDFACDTLGSVGVMTKTIRFLGKSVAHTVSSYQAVNSLSAATLAIQAINTLYETFRNEECVMIAYTFASEPSLAETVLNIRIKGATMKAMAAASRKVNRAAFASAAAVGATVEISNGIGSYAPMRSSDELLSVMKSCMEDLVGVDKLNFLPVINKGCTDMGDVSHVIPCIHPFVCGAVGSVHSTEFRIADPDRACVNAAKVQLMLANRLLCDNGRLAYEVMERFVPVAGSFAEHLANVEKTCVAVESELNYSEDGESCIASMRRVQ